MNREIKFRLWNAEHENMVFCEMAKMNFDCENGNALLFCENGSRDIVGCESNNYGRKFKVMQCSGLKDKNGIDIYEGDIIKGKLIYNGFLSNDGTLPTMGTIEYCEGFAAFCIKNDGGQTLFHNHVINSFQVIGNIYENPELING